MNLKEQNILFLTRTMQLGGTENVILQLCEIFKPEVGKIVVCSCGGMNVEKLTAMGIKHYEIPDIEGKSLSTIVSAIKTIRYVVKHEKITVIHTHHRMAAFYVSLLGLYRKYVFFNTSHNTFDNKRALTRFAYKHANLIACGDMVKKNLTEYFGIPEKQITVVHNAIKPFSGVIKADPVVEQLHRSGCFVIGNVGRLSEQKGMEYYIQAVPGVIERHPETRFLIIGAGEGEEKLKCMVKNENLEQFVYFTGYCGDVQNLMAQLDLIVLSSLWEGFPLTPIEAFSVAKSVIATAVDGTVEIVEDGKNGLLTEPRNSEQLSYKIIWMIEHPEERKSMEQGGLNSYRKNFSFEKMAVEYMKCYKTIER